MEQRTTQLCRTCDKVLQSSMPRNSLWAVLSAAWRSLPRRFSAAGRLRKDLQNSVARATKFCSFQRSKGSSRDRGDRTSPLDGLGHIRKLRSMAGLTFVYLHRVPYSLCTLGNHVYYSRYLDILETARGEFFREFGTTFQQWQEGGTIFPVIECHLKYKSPARYDDLLRVELSIATAEGA